MEGVARLPAARVSYARCVSSRVRYSATIPPICASNMPLPNKQTAMLNTFYLVVFQTTGKRVCFFLPALRSAPHRNAFHRFLRAERQVAERRSRAHAQVNKVHYYTGMVSPACH